MIPRCELCGRRFWADVAVPFPFDHRVCEACALIVIETAIDTAIAEKAKANRPKDAAEQGGGHDGH